VTLSVGSTIDGYPNGGSFPVSVTTTPPSGCSWTATTQAAWINRKLPPIAEYRPPEIRNCFSVIPRTLEARWQNGQ